MVVIFIRSIDMVLMISLCALICDDEYKNRVVFLISDRFAYAYYYVD